MSAAKLWQIVRRDFAVFISHASEDRVEAERLAECLEQEGVRTWLSLVELPPSEHFPPRIAREIQRCLFFLLLVSSHSKVSQFVGIEIGLRIKRANRFAFGSEQLDTENVIVAVLDRATDCTPVFFQDIHTLHFARQGAPMSHEEPGEEVSEKDAEQAAAEIAQIVYLERPKRRFSLPSSASLRM